MSGARASWRPADEGHMGQPSSCPHPWNEGGELGGPRHPAKGSRRHTCWEGSTRGKQVGRRGVAPPATTQPALGAWGPPGARPPPHLALKPRGCAGRSGPGGGSVPAGGPGPFEVQPVGPQVLGPQPRKVRAPGRAAQPPGASLHPGPWLGCTVSLSHTHTHTRARAFPCRECTPGLPEGRICPYLRWQLEVPVDSSLALSRPWPELLAGGGCEPSLGTGHPAKGQTPHAPSVWGCGEPRSGPLFPDALSSASPAGRALGWGPASAGSEPGLPFLCAHPAPSSLHHWQ